MPGAALPPNSIGLIEETEKWTKVVHLSRVGRTEESRMPKDGSTPN
jgi:hypothetical protein